MPVFNYKCNSCGDQNEYISGTTYNEKIPDICPKCNIGVLERQFSPTKAYSIVWGGYDMTHGKRNWRNQPASKQADALTPNANGNYKDPY